MRAHLVILLACSMFLVGCPKEKRALNGARKAVEVAAQTVDLVDAEVAVLYTDASDTAIAECDTLACYDSEMRRWSKTVLAVSSMKTSLLLVENALDAWEVGSPNGHNNLLGAAACFAESLVQLHALLTDLDVKAPALDHGLDYIDNIFGSSGFACPIGA